MARTEAIHVYGLDKDGGMPLTWISGSGEGYCLFSCVNFCGILRMICDLEAS